jgi:ArsR family transcriptional regulator
MKILVDSGLVNDRKEGKWHYYSINTDIMKEFCGFIKTLCNETTGKCCKGKA